MFGRHFRNSQALTLESIKKGSRSNRPRFRNFNPSRFGSMKRLRHQAVSAISTLPVRFTMTFAGHLAAHLPQCVHVS